MGTTAVAVGVVVAWALTRPATLFLNFPRGFWIQAGWSVLCGGTSIVLTAILADYWGAPGAFLANAIALTTFMALPLTAITLRIIRRERNHNRSGER